jgi:superfamily I DNA and/or RNA helicase
VAGDRHQLPPTTFFATGVEGEDDILEDDDKARDALTMATAAIGGFESLLGTLEAFLPNWLLEWHYRSEDERLIAFSNTHIYGGRPCDVPERPRSRGDPAHPGAARPCARWAGGECIA